MPVTGETESYQPRLFPGQLLLVENVSRVSAFKPPALCRVTRKDRVPARRPRISISPARSTMVLWLDDGPHEWLVAKGWSYRLQECPRHTAVFLDLDEAAQAVMFKLTWHGVDGGV
jgi:hypothetical protein